MGRGVAMSPATLRLRRFQFRWWWPAMNADATEVVEAHDAADAQVLFRNNAPQWNRGYCLGQVFEQVALPPGEQDE